MSELNIFCEEKKFIIKEVVSIIMGDCDYDSVKIVIVNKYNHFLYITFNSIKQANECIKYINRKHLLEGYNKIDLCPFEKYIEKIDFTIK